MQREMQWTWIGHAIVSPGWRVTFQSVARTYCGEKVGSKEIKSLEALRQSSRDWRPKVVRTFCFVLCGTSMAAHMRT